MQLNFYFTPESVAFQVDADFHIGDRDVSMETDVHLLGHSL